MSVIIKLRLYRAFWEIIAFLAPEKGLAWLSKTNIEEWGRRDANKILKAIIRHLPNTDLKKVVVLDYGCGIGRVAKYVAPKVGKVICADVSKNYLEKARTHLREFNNIEYLRVNGEDLRKLPSEIIDCVYSIGIFVHINKQDSLNLFREINRVLKRGGLFIVDLPRPGAKMAVI